MISNPFLCSVRNTEMTRHAQEEDTLLNKTQDMDETLKNVVVFVYNAHAWLWL